MTVFNAVASCTLGLNPEKRNWAKSTNANYQQALIYNGKVGNKINIAYREYDGDLTKPILNNSVEYDLSQVNQIGYKGALIEVVSADNQRIQYRVIRGFINR